MLCRYVKKTDDLQKELADTKSSLGGEIELLKERVQELETQLGQQKKRKVVIDADEVNEDRNLDSLEILAEVAQQTHATSPKVAESSKLNKPIQFSRRSRRQYLAKKSAESSKVSNDDEIQMTDAGDTLQDNESIIDVVAENTTEGVHT